MASVGVGDHAAHKNLITISRTNAGVSWLVKPPRNEPARKQREYEYLNIGLVITIMNI